MQCERRLHGISGIAFSGWEKQDVCERVQPVNLQQGLTGKELRLGAASRL